VYATVATVTTTHLDTTTMTSPLAQANSIAASDPAEAEKLYKQILQNRAGKTDIASVLLV
jgi:hypothetical protein